MRAAGKTLFFVLLMMSLARPVWADDALLRSLLLPGSGQAQRGHFGRAALFASAAVASGLGLYISQIHYNRAADSYNDAKRSYATLSDRLDRGDVVSYEEITSTYQKMQSELDTAKDRYRWRNAFLVTLIGCYALNVGDLILNGPDEGDGGTGLSVRFDGESVKLVKSIRF